MTDLRAAILARLDELERLARDAIKTNPGGNGRWTAVEVYPDEAEVVDADGARIARYTHWYPDMADGMDPEDARHIAAWDPDSVLALVVGAREMVGLHSPDVDPMFNRSGCVGCGSLPDYADRHVDDCPTLAALAKMLGVRAGA